MTASRLSLGALATMAGLASAVAGVYADSRAADATQAEVLRNHERALDDQRKQTERMLELLAEIRERLVRVEAAVGAPASPNIHRSQ